MSMFAMMGRYLAGAVIDRVEDGLVRMSTLLSRRRLRELARRERDRPREDGRWFTAGESTLVDALASLIVPSDEFGPGAQEAGVAAALDRLLARSGSRRRLYASGLLACDEWARREHGRAFVELTPEQQVALLQWVDRIRDRWAGARSMTAKMARRAVFLYQRWHCPLFELFPRLVRDVLDAFYTSQVSWDWLGYDGPPMPHGYPDLLERRSSLPERHTLGPLDLSGDTGATMRTMR